MDRTERFYKIDRLLQGGQPVSFKAMMEKLGISRAQLKRDLDYMRERFNAPIEYDRERNGYVFGKPLAGPRYELPGLWFNAGEAYALMSMHALLDELQPGLLAPHVAPLQERLRAILGGEPRAGQSGAPGWDDIRHRIRIFQPERRAAAPEHFGTIAAAVLRRLRLHIRHYNRRDDRETEREISPQRLVHYRGNWYVDGWCHLREDLRSFAVDAIRAAELRDTRAKDIAAARLDEHLGAGYGIFAGGKVSWAKLRFTPEAARWVSVQQWHPKQRGSTEKDGSYVLEVPYAEDRELVMEILRYGPDVEVLAPPALRQRVAEALQAAAKRYRP